MRIEAFGQSRVERIIVEIDIALPGSIRARILMLEFVKHKIVDIRIGRLRTPKVLRLLSRGFIKIPLEVADKFGRFFGGLCCFGFGDRIACSRW